MLFFIGVVYILSLTSDKVEHNPKTKKINIGYMHELSFDSIPNHIEYDAINLSIFDNLIYKNYSNDLAPALITTFKWNPEDSSYLLELKQNVHFHNGREVTAKDLEFSLLRNYYLYSGSRFKNFYRNIKGIKKIKNSTFHLTGNVSGIEVIEKYKLKITLNTKDESFIYFLANNQFLMLPQEELKSDYNTWRNKPVGCGHYKYLNKEKDTYTLKSTTPKDKSPKVIKLISNDISNNVDLVLHNHLKKQTLKRSYSKDFKTATSIAFNYKNPISHNPKLREAINYAISRDYIVEGRHDKQALNEVLPSKQVGRLNILREHNIIKAKTIVKGLESELKSSNFLVDASELNSNDSNDLEILNLTLLQIRNAGINISLLDPNKNSDKNKVLLRFIKYNSDSFNTPDLLSELKRKRENYFPLKDNEINKFLESDYLSQSQESKIKNTKKIAMHIHTNNYFVPLYESKATILTNYTKVKDLGNQNIDDSLIIKNILMK